MAGQLRTLTPTWRPPGAPWLAVLVVPCLAAASAEAAEQRDSLTPASFVGDAEAGDSALASANDPELASFHAPSFGPPRETPGVPSDEELEAAHAVIGT